MTQEAADRDGWDAHWQRYGTATESNPAEKLRVDLVLSHLGIGDQQARVIDIGSGQGEMLATLLARCPDVEAFGVELSRTGVEMARRRAPSAEFLQWNLLQPQPVPARWACWATHAICSEVLEHVDEPGRLLQSARQFLAPGCHLVVTVPGGPKSAFDHHIGHRRHYSRRDLEKLLRQNGFEQVRTTAAGFPFFNLYRLVVIFRGRRLVEDVAQREQDGASISATARLVMRAFEIMFRFNFPRSPWGWQIVGVARQPR